MPNISYVGLAPEQPQIDTIQIVAVSSGAQFEIYAGQYSRAPIVYTAGGGDTATTVRDALFALLSASTRPKEYASMSASTSSTDTLIITGSGQRPLSLRYYCRFGAAMTATTTQAANGPQWISRPENWSLTRSPETGDSVLIENWWGDLLYGLEDLQDVAPAGIVIRGLRGALGLPWKNAAAPFAEYLPRYWKIKPTILNIGSPSGVVPESTHMRIDVSSAAASIVVNNTGAASETGREALIVKGSAINQAKLHRGSIGFATDPGDTASVATLLVLVASQRTGAAGLFVRTSAGCAVSNSTINGGQWECFAAPSQPIQYLGGEFVPNEFDPDFNTGTSVPFRIAQ